VNLPRVFFDAEGQSLPLSGWTASNTTNLGYDQLRGTIAANVARRVHESIRQGSVITARSEDGPVVWQGRVSAPPRILGDGTAQIAAQGHGYDAVKYTRRLGLRVSDMKAWASAHESPFNWPTGAVGGSSTISPQQQTAGLQRLIATPTGSPTRMACCIWAPGTRFTRIQGFINDDSVTACTVFTSNGPDLFANRRFEYRSTADVSAYADVTFTNPGDAVVMELTKVDGSAFSGVDLFVNGTVSSVTRPFVLFGDTPPTMFAEDGAKAIARRLGWSDALVHTTDGAPISQLDIASSAAAALTDLCAEDYCWRCLDDATYGVPVLEFGPYRKVWEVSGRTGARWDLTPLELYNKVVVQYLQTSRTTLNYVLGSTFVDGDNNPQLVNQITQLMEDRPNLLADGVSNELGLALSNQQSDTGLAGSVALKMFKVALSQRWRGNVEFSRAFEAGSGREAAREVLAGDLLRITDFTADGSITLRIADVTQSPAGIVVGIEAPSLPIGSLGVPGVGAAASGGAVYSAPAELQSYVPVTGPSPVVGGGGGGGIYKDVYGPGPKPGGGGFPK
jgi:hypothetical protein